MKIKAALFLCAKHGRYFDENQSGSFILAGSSL
jgi:hypothetical protein